MEQWRPLFALLLSSPTPETDAVRWFDSHNHNHNQPNSSPLTYSFLALLLSPIPSTSLLFLQTLPSFLQSRILSFLSSYRLRFDSLQLHSLATKMVMLGGSAFWVKRAACKLLDEMPERSFPKDSFFDLPPWLRDTLSNEAPLLPWLPFDKSMLPERKTKHLHVLEEQICEEPVSLVSSCLSPRLAPSLSDHAIEQAMVLKREISTVESVPEILALAEKIQNMCIETQNPMEVLSLIEPWEINDDLARVLLSNFSLQNGASLILSSIILPKMLTLQKHPTSLIISTTLEYCKKHPVEAVNALLLPLIFRIQGLNMPICDLIAKVTKDCMHPLHVSFFIQTVLCADEGTDRKPVCLPQHLKYISNELIWNEPMFQLFYNMINSDKDVILTPDTIQNLVSVIEEMANKFAKSLKFGSFVLCFVSKFGNKLRSHKDLLEKAVKKTDTFVKKAILARLYII
ncbi:fanconi anemia group E protein FANCE protein [Rhynchospora pubera]|uniref:Fanconi anemia group E protein FANCE protein n=1 Tax=Rhynchospora pubera TaxID=906938 RepID=A0AAV8GSM8_9POAL|nr:fanconi anemia group E protein FANCE protein [Rhynchospora pubera]